MECYILFLLDPEYEKPNDVVANIRIVLLQSDMTTPVVNGRLGSGTWQGIHIWKHQPPSA